LFSCEIDQKKFTIDGVSEYIYENLSEPQQNSENKVTSPQQKIIVVSIFGKCTEIQRTNNCHYCSQTKIDEPLRLFLGVLAD
jgi:hypothetical protein